MNEGKKKGWLTKVGKKYAQMGKADPSKKKKGWKPMVVHSAKTGIDVVGSGVGVTGAFATGIWSPLIAPITGVLLMGAGHFLGDKTGVLRIVGASMFGYGLAKVTRKEESDETIDGFDGFADKAKRRLGEFKNEWMKAFFLDKLVGSSSESSSTAIDGFGAIDLSALDTIDESIKQSAISHEMNLMDQEEMMEEDEVIHFSVPDEDMDEELNFVSMPEEEFDLSTI